MGSDPWSNRGQITGSAPSLLSLGIQINGEMETAGNHGFGGSLPLGKLRSQRAVIPWELPREASYERPGAVPLKTARCDRNRPVLGAIRPIDSFRPFPFPFF